MPGSQKKITVRRDGYIYYLNPEDKSATRLTQPEPASPASGVEQTGDLKEYVKTLAKNGAQVTGTRRIGSEDTNEYTIPTRNTSAVHTSSVHKLWVSVASQMPVMETIESPNVKTTIVYQNVQMGQELPDELFAIPPDFKTVDVGKQPRTIPAQPPVPKK
jgi:outer membrane lipoprotein-sorting protein